MSVYERLGLRRVINADATLTRLGGSLMPPDVLDAMRDAAGSFVDMHELQRAADRSLFVRRRQDGRPMMLEALHCGHDARWAQTLVKLDWATPMRSDARAFRLACMGAESLSCRWEDR